MVRNENAPQLGSNLMAYEPVHLSRWTRPSNYAGAEWLDYYSSGVGRSRDSDAIERTNFDAMLTTLGGECDKVIVVNEGHWAVGWVEWIAVHESDARALKIADDLNEQLQDYPLLDEEACSNLEWEEAADFWDSLSPREKVREAMRHRERYHWLRTVPVWPFGRWSFDQLANAEGAAAPIASALCEQLQTSS